jgi:hypothetical protein
MEYDSMNQYEFENGCILQSQRRNFEKYVQTNA